jgi:hypothetical protein
VANHDHCNGNHSDDRNINDGNDDGVGNGGSSATTLVSV